jgi:PAS domain S-box-containing protein
LLTTGVPWQEIMGFVRESANERPGMELTLNTRHESRNEAAGLPPAVESLIWARTDDAVFVVDPEFRVVHWDARAESLTGFLAEEVVGRPCYEVVSAQGGTGDCFDTRVRSAMRLARAGHPVPGYDVSVLTRTNGRRWVNLSTLAVDSGRGPYLVHLMRDVQEAHEVLEMARGLIRPSSGETGHEKSGPAPRDVPTLTGRQLEVLELLATGKSARDIGAKLYLSQATVRNHIRALLQGLGAHSQLEALARAREFGLLAR